MDIRYALIGAANCFGFVIDACNTIVRPYREIEEHAPVETDRFVEYVRDRLVLVLENYAYEERNSVVYSSGAVCSKVRQLGLQEKTLTELVVSRPESSESLEHAEIALCILLLCEFE